MRDKWWLCLQTISEQYVCGLSNNNFQVSEPFYKFKWTNEKGRQCVWDSRNHLDATWTVMYPVNVQYRSKIPMYKKLRH